MSDGAPGDKPHIEIATDEDWKSRVKAEDAKLDAKRTAEAPRPEPTLSDSDMPPASFPMIVQMLSTQAILSLGIIPAPDGTVMKQLPLAKHCVDLLSVLDEKTRGNLNSTESKFLEQTLHELRMAYVEVSRNEPAGADESSAAP